MVRHIALFSILAAALATVGCKKKDGDSAGSKGAEPAKPAVGCGSDYADPDKQFCIKLPAGYAFEKTSKDDSGITHEFKGPEQYFHVLVWTNPQFTYDYQLGIYGPAMKQADHTDVAAGGTPGQTQWWTYKFGTEKPLITALAKSASGMAIQCDGDAQLPAPEILEACKTLRPYPGGPALPAAPAK